MTTPTQTDRPIHELLLTTEQLATLQEALADAQDEHRSINPSSPYGGEIAALIDYIDAHVVERAQPTIEEGTLRVFILCDEDTTWREHGVLHREGFCPHNDLPTHDVTWSAEVETLIPRDPGYKERCAELGITPHPATP